MKYVLAHRAAGGPLGRRHGQRARHEPVIGAVAPRDASATCLTCHDGSVTTAPNVKTDVNKLADLLDMARDDPEAFSKFQQAQGELSGALSRLLVVTENYPNLKANQGFQDLRVQLEGTENRITVARNRYIQTVQEYNVLARSSRKSWLETAPFNTDPRRDWRSESITTTGPYDLMVEAKGRFKSHFAGDASMSTGKKLLAESSGDARIIVAGDAVAPGPSVEDVARTGSWAARRLTTG